MAGRVLAHSFSLSRSWQISSLLLVILVLVISRAEDYFHPRLSIVSSPLLCPWPWGDILSWPDIKRWPIVGFESPHAPDSVVSPLLITGGIIQDNKGPADVSCTQCVTSPWSQVITPHWYRADTLWWPGLTNCWCIYSADHKGLSLPGICFLAALAPIVFSGGRELDLGLRQLFVQS